MYQPGMILSPLSRAKKKMSDNARRLFFVQLVIIVINVIINGLIISLVLSFFGLGYNPIIYWDLLAFMDQLFGTIMYIFILEIIHLIIRVVYYIFFFILSSSFQNLGNVGPQLTSSAKKAANLMIIALIAEIIGNIIILFDFITPFILYIVSFCCMSWGFANVNHTLRELKQNKLVNVEGNLFIPLGNGIKAGGLILFFISSFLYITWGTFFSLTIVFFVCMFVGEVMIAFGLYRLNQYADQITDPQPYIQEPVPAYPQPQPQYQQYPQQQVQQQPREHGSVQNVVKNRKEVQNSVKNVDIVSKISERMRWRKLKSIGEDHILGMKY
ncbi:MAG: hypothetical protein ACXABJ_11020 [Candidatus Heimdallarchaeaceae archaeon]|jgi:hypothetical protein